MTFDELNGEVFSLNGIKNIDFFTLGFSMLNQPIYAAHIGSYDGKQIFINGGIHAREWISVSVCVELCKIYSKKTFVGGMYFVPMINPDGIRLCLDGVQSVKCQKQQNFLLDCNNQNMDFSLWKADTAAVDLNVNFNALWGGGIKNVFCPASENFVGYYANSQREVRLMIEFVENINPAVTICYHTKGEVIYWGFEALTEKELARDFNVVEAIANATNYAPIKTENSTGGLSDFIALVLRKTAMTIELGKSEIPHPLTEENLSLLVEQNMLVPQIAIDKANELDL